MTLLVEIGANLNIVQYFSVFEKNPLDGQALPSLKISPSIGLLVLLVKRFPTPGVETWDSLNNEVASATRLLRPLF